MADMAKGIKSFKKNMSEDESSSDKSNSDKESSNKDQ